MLHGRILTLATYSPTWLQPTHQTTSIYILTPKSKLKIKL